MIYLSAFADESATSLPGQISALKRNGIRYIELRNIDGVSVKDFTIEQAQKYEKELSDNDISVWSIGSPLGKVDIGIDFEEYEKTIRHLCELAKVFKTNKIRMFSFFHAYDKAQKVYEYLNKMVRIASEYGVELYHENEKDIFGDTAERVQLIMDNVKGLKFVYDPANYLQVGEFADATLEKFHNKTDYFHIKDVISATGELVPAGYGDGKIAELIDRIKDDKVLSVEPHLAVFDAYKSIDNSEMKHKFHFSSNEEAFDAAVKALKELLIKAGYQETNGGFLK